MVVSQWSTCEIIIFFQGVSNNSACSSVCINFVNKTAIIQLTFHKRPIILFSHSLKPPVICLYGLQ